MRAAIFQLRLPRNPLLRLLIAVAGIALLSMFALVGVGLAVAALALFGARALWWTLRGRPQTSAPAWSRRTDVIEGDYTVIEKSAEPLPPRNTV
jgi:hypothetical protein